MSAAWFAGRLRELREAAGLSRLDLALKAGLKPGTVRDLEQGRRKPQWATVLALAGALGESCEVFNAPPKYQGPPVMGRPPKKSRGKKK